MQIGIPAAVREALGDVGALLFPVECAGCGAGDVSLCAACRAALTPMPTVRTVAGARVCSALRFEGVTADVIRTLKEDGRTSLAGPLGAALAVAVARTRPGLPEDAVFVPVPSSRASFRRRGFRPVETLMRRAGVPITRALQLTRSTADQRGLEVAERAANLSGAFEGRRVAGQDVVVVDDVVTTGATLAEAIRALRAAGARVAAAVTLADTPRRSMFAEREADACGIPT